MWGKWKLVSVLDTKPVGKLTPNLRDDLRSPNLVPEKAAGG